MQCSLGELGFVVKVLRLISQEVPALKAWRSNSKFTDAGLTLMTNVIEKLIKSDADIKRDIIKEFTSDLMKEVQKLVNKHGKDEFKKMLNA